MSDIVERARRRRWHWFFRHEITWREWEIGIALYLGAWWPREWSMALFIGPVIVAAGWEARDAK
jgi:hypothetical protein